MPSWEWRDRIREIARGWLFSDVPPESFPRSVVLPLENPDLYDDRPFIERLSDVVCYKGIAIGSVDGRTIGIARSKFGAPAVAMAVESLAGMGVERIVGVGFCGGLSETLRCGDLVLPLAAVRDEGTTARYVPEGYPAAADFDELCRLRALALTQELRHHVGLVWSTDAPLLESSELVRTWGSRGVLGVDMELSALFTLARLSRIRAAAILVVSDNPAACAEMEPSALSSGCSAAARLAVEFMSAANPPRPK